MINKAGEEFLIGAADIGNSRVKLLVENHLAFFDYNSTWIKELENFLEATDGKKVLLGYSSVKATGLNIILDMLKNYEGIEAVSASHLLANQEMLQYSHIGGIGQDRLLGLIGGMSVAAPPLITVDCGTALTINAVDKSGSCRGGAIIAGAYTQLESLSANTEELPSVNLKYVSEAAGKNTDDAIRSGIVYGLAGAIREISAKIIFQEFGGYNPPIFLTGGYAKILLPALIGGTRKIILKQNLVLEGIVYLLKNVNFEP